MLLYEFVCTPTPRAFLTVVYAFLPARRSQGAVCDFILHGRPGPGGRPEAGRGPGLGWVGVCGRLDRENATEIAWPCFRCFHFFRATSLAVARRGAAPRLAPGRSAACGYALETSSARRIYSSPLS